MVKLRAFGCDLISWVFSFEACALALDVADKCILGPVDPTEMYTALLAPAFSISALFFTLAQILTSM
ncbi:uncharacterized protein PHALS_09260 [Plasmopara halstedii]|uniref:Uncharacterized protein n=1 Tax=Plasmopara halstedii TaxID=4781 RepID=A0A0P1AEU5_PLAHL|nr:uncharacterized protein PHALS_09260 [Plasmopara halstedii]CEG39206.1 hypothetical protein PHALS_09260 [Plasmopara halstedii]|eukprot:XP_024575575.1 hypothetical protein PHALS_09260 [Plasmopara halstedii]